MNLSRVLPGAVLCFTICGFTICGFRICAAAAQPQQSTQQPPAAAPGQAAAGQAPPAGDKNGPGVGPRENKPGPDQRSTDPGAQAQGRNNAEREAMRNFLAIGAAPDPAAVQRGQATFVANCGFCHGSRGSGGAQGPNLVRSVLVLHDQGTGKEIGPVVHNGRAGKGMPAFPNLTDAQIHDIAAFLLGRTQEAANRMEYKIQNIVTGDAKAGEAYFSAHCAECHSGTADLAHIAAKYDPVALQGRFLYPETNNYFGGGPPPDPRSLKHATVTLPSGQSYTGTLERIDDFSVALRDSNDVYHSWPLGDDSGVKVQIQDPLAQHAQLLRQYSDADMHNILAYLETLK